MRMTTAMKGIALGIAVLGLGMMAGCGGDQKASTAMPRARPFIAVVIRIEIPPLLSFQICKIHLLYMDTHKKASIHTMKNAKGLL